MNQQAKTSFSALLRGAWESTSGERPRLFLFVILFILAYTLDLLVPWAIGYTLGVFVDLGFSSEAWYKGVWGIAAYTALRLGYTICHHFARYVQNRVAYTARMNMTLEIFAALMRFPLRWHVSHHSGENLSRLHRSAGAIDSMIGTYVWQIIEGGVKVIFAGIAIFALDFFVAANVLFWSTASVLFMILFNKRLTGRIRRNNLFNDKVNRICLDYLNNIVTVKTLGVEQAAQKQIESQKAEGLRLSQSISAFMEMKWGITSVGYALVISSSLLIYFYSHSLQPGAFEVAQVYVLLNYLDRIFQAIGSFTGYYSGLIEAATAYEDASGIFSLSSATPDNRQLVGIDNLTWTKISVKKLNFSYVTGDKIGLNNVKFEFLRGEKIALVGHSGSGKSTLLKVFGGLILPDSYILSTDVRENITFDELTSSVLLVPQEPEIFSESVRYNLTMGEEFEPREIAFFVSLCKIDQLIERLPNGLDSNLAQKGLNLSVGEKQRIALARGLLRASRKEIVLLDEPTSSLDTKNEKEIFLGLLYHFSSRTIISSVHRLNLVPLFDRVVYMAQSSVVEVGTFPELIEQKGHFYKIWEDYQQNVQQGSGNAAGSLDVVGGNG